VLDCLSLSPQQILHLLSSPSIKYLFSHSSFPHLNLVILFFSLLHSLSLGTPEFPLLYTLLYLDSLILSLLSCLSLSLSSTFIHLPFALNFSTSSLYFSLSPSSPCSFSFSPALRQYPALFPSIHFLFKLCRSLSRFHSQSIPLALFPHYVTWRFSDYS
jgi:hypothetical protein